MFDFQQFCVPCNRELDCRCYFRVPNKDYTFYKRICGDENNNVPKCITPEEVRDYVTLNGIDISSILSEQEMIDELQSQMRPRD